MNKHLVIGEKEYKVKRLNTFTMENVRIFLNPLSTIITHDKNRIVVQYDNYIYVIKCRDDGQWNVKEYKLVE